MNSEIYPALKVLTNKNMFIDTIEKSSIDFQYGFIQHFMKIDSRSV